MRSRMFLHVSLGILALALAYHFGARSATAQAPGNPIIAITGLVPGTQANAVLANGDVYVRIGDSWRWNENIFGSATPAVTRESFGSLKARYRGELEPQGVKPSTGR